MRLWQVSRTLFVPLWTVWGVWGCEGMWWWTVYISVQVFRDLWTKYWWYFQVFLCKWQTSNLGEHVSMATYLPDLSRHSQWVCVMCVCVWCVYVYSHRLLSIQRRWSVHIWEDPWRLLCWQSTFFSIQISFWCVCAWCCECEDMSDWVWVWGWGVVIIASCYYLI